MKIRIILVVVIAIILSTIKVFGQEKPVETEKQKEVSAQFQKEVKQIQDELEKAVLPIEGQKYRLDEQIKQLQIEAQKKLVELQNKYTELYKNADKEKK